MHEELLPYSVGDAHFDALVVRPADEARPAVLVCHAWGGRNDFAEARARELAGLGYVGAAIDVYGVGKRASDPVGARALMSALLADPPELRARLSAAFEAVRGLSFVKSERCAIIGYCFGGMCALLAARMGLPLAGAVSFHGLLEVGEPLDAKVQARIMVQHGQDDPMVPPADVGAFAAHMQTIGAEWQLHAYPGVVHSFTDPRANSPESGSAYDADAARRSWAEMRSFLEEVLGAR